MPDQLHRCNAVHRIYCGCTKRNSGEQTLENTFSFKNIPNKSSQVLIGGKIRRITIEYVVCSNQTVQVLLKYRNLLVSETPYYMAAIALHPSFRTRYFKEKWNNEEEQASQWKSRLHDLWISYKDLFIPLEPTPRTLSASDPPAKPPGELSEYHKWRHLRQSIRRNGKIFSMKQILRYHALPLSDGLNLSRKRDGQLSRIWPLISYQCQQWATNPNGPFQQVVEQWLGIGCHSVNKAFKFEELV